MYWARDDKMAKRRLCPFMISVSVFPETASDHLWGSSTVQKALEGLSWHIAAAVGCQGCHHKSPLKSEPVRLFLLHLLSFGCSFCRAA